MIFVQPKKRVIQSVLPTTNEQEGILQTPKDWPKQCCCFQFSHQFATKWLLVVKLLLYLTSGWSGKNHRRACRFDSKSPCNNSSPHRIHGTNGIFTYVWSIFMVNVGKYTIHGSYRHLGGWNILIVLDLFFFLVGFRFLNNWGGGI